METKWVEIRNCSDVSWWYYRCEGMKINVYRQPHVSHVGNIVFSVVGTHSRTVLVEDVVDTCIQ